MNEASVRRVSCRAVVGENLALRPARHDPIAVLDAWARNLAAQDLKLLTQNQDLDILGTIPRPRNTSSSISQQKTSYTQPTIRACQPRPSTRERPGQQPDRISVTHRVSLIWVPDVRY